MPERPARTNAFWETVTARVTERVAPALGRSPQARAPVIEYLRDLEVLARQESCSREAVQVIASGRRLLGDSSELGAGMAKSLQMAWADPP